MPCGKITDHNSSLNHFVSNEVGRFMHTVLLLVAFLFRDAFVDFAEMDVPPRLLLALVALGADLVELFVVPASTLKAAHLVDSALIVHAGGQRFDAQVKGQHFTCEAWLFLFTIAERGG